MDWSIPRLTLGRVPLARHSASQLRFLELRVPSSASILYPYELDATIVVVVKYFDHLSRSGDVDPTVLPMNEEAVSCKIPRVDFSRGYILLKDLSHLSLLGIF